MQTNTQVSEWITFWITGTCLALLLMGFILYFIILYRRKQDLFDRERKERELLYQHQLLETQVEIRNESVNHLARELHDNLGQMASFIKMQLDLYLRKEEAPPKEELTDLRDHTQKLIDDMRALSRGLNSQNLERFGLTDMMWAEVNRVKKLQLCEVDLVIDEEGVAPDNEQSIFLYRIFQELLTNILRHAEASRASIRLYCSGQDLCLECSDNGKGFDTALVRVGSGLMNIRQRCDLIGATLKIQALPGGGAQFLVTLPLA